MEYPAVIVAPGQSLPGKATATRQKKNHNTHISHSCTCRMEKNASLPRLFPCPRHERTTRSRADRRPFVEKADKRRSIRQSRPEKTPAAKPGATTYKGGRTGGIPAVGIWFRITYPLKEAPGTVRAGGRNEKSTPSGQKRPFQHSGQHTPSSGKSTLFHEAKVSA